MVVVGRSAAEGRLDEALLGAIFFARHTGYAQVFEAVQKSVQHPFVGPESFETADSLIVLSAHAFVADLLEVVGRVGQLQLITELVNRCNRLRARVRVGRTDELCVVQAERGADRLILALIDAVTCERLVVLLQQRAPWLDLSVEIVHARLFERFDATKTRLICMTNVRTAAAQKCQRDDQRHQNERPVAGPAFEIRPQATAMSWTIIGPIGSFTKVRPPGE